MTMQSLWRQEQFLHSHHGCCFRTLIKAVTWKQMLTKHEAPQQSDPSTSPLLLPWGTWLNDRGRHQRHYKVTLGYCLPAWPVPGQSVSCHRWSYKWQNQLAEHQLMEQTVLLHTEGKSFAVPVTCSQLITKIILYRWDLLSCCQGPVSPL